MKYNKKKQVSRKSFPEFGRGLRCGCRTGWGWFCRSATGAARGMGFAAQISIDQAAPKKRDQGAFILDVREPSESTRIPHSWSHPHPPWETCQSGSPKFPGPRGGCGLPVWQPQCRGRGYSFKRWLANDMAGGVTQWQKQGLAIRQSKSLSGPVSTFKTSCAVSSGQCAEKHLWRKKIMDFFSHLFLTAGHFSPAETAQVQTLGAPKTHGHFCWMFAPPGIQTGHVPARLIPLDEL